VLDLNNISVWDFFQNANEGVDGDDFAQANNRHPGALGMALSLSISPRGGRVAGEAQLRKIETEQNHAHQLQELFRNDMINMDKLPVIRKDSQNYSGLDQLED